MITLTKSLLLGRVDKDTTEWMLKRSISGTFIKYLDELIDQHIKYTNMEEEGRPGVTAEFTLDVNQLHDKVKNKSDSLV